MTFEFSLTVEDMRAIGPKPRKWQIYAGTVFWGLILMGSATILVPPLWTVVSAIPDMDFGAYQDLPSDQQAVMRTGFVAVVLALILMLSMAGFFIWSLRGANRMARLVKSSDPAQMGLTEGLHFGPSKVTFEGDEMHYVRTLYDGYIHRDAIASITADNSIFITTLHSGGAFPLGTLEVNDKSEDFAAAADLFLHEAGS